MSLKEEVVENACSQLSLAEPSEGSCAAAAHTDSKIARTVSGHKRSVPATAATERRNHSQRACRELFRPHHAQAGPSAQPGTHPSDLLPISPLAEANVALSARQATAAQVAQPPTVSPSAVCAPVSDSCSVLRSNSGQVLHNRLSSSNLLPSTTATGQQLLQLEVQLQGLLGIRKDEDGTNNICWVDHGFLHYAQGVLYFHGFYGDAECAQVTASSPLSCDINCQSVYSELYHYTIWFCSQKCTLSSSITTAIPSTLYQCEGHTSTSYCLPRCHPQSPLHVIISCKVPQTSSFNAVMHTAQICMLVRPCR